MDREEINVDGIALPTTHYAEAVRFGASFDLAFAHWPISLHHLRNMQNRDSTHEGTIERR